MTIPLRTLIFDTETTGLWSKEDEMMMHQPWPVQIGAVLLSEDLQIERSMNCLVRVPEGGVFQEKAVEVHGLTPEFVQKEGRDTGEVYEEFRSLLADASCVAAYNLPYDHRIMRTSAARIGIPPLFTEQHVPICIMEQVECVLQRRVKLRVAYRKFTGQEITDAHDAFADTLAATEVFRKLVTLHG